MRAKALMTLSCRQQNAIAAMRDVTDTPGVT